MAPSPLSAREVLLLCLLLFTLLFFRNEIPHRDILYRQLNRLSPSFATNRSYASHSPTQDSKVRLSWGSSRVPETKVIAHVPGWSMFDKLYLYNGTLFIVTDKPDTVPEPAAVYSKGIEVYNGEEAERSRLPTDEDFQVVSTKEAKQLFGSGAQAIDGMTFFVNDPKQYLTHYYHWSAELLYGLWRTYSSLDTTITSDGRTFLDPPKRMMFSHIDAGHWRDYASMNQFVTRTAFPSLIMEFRDDWLDRIQMNTTFVFDRVILADRSAAIPTFTYQRSQRTASVPFALPGSGNSNWWMAIRNNVIRFTGMEVNVGGGTTETPVITYVSRQEWTRRKLILEDHDNLVRELYKLRDEHGYEVNVIRLAARTTILMGAHGNGLTALLWMNPTPRATVMEFFFPQGFAYDYEFTARAMGIKHYGFWGSKALLITTPWQIRPFFLNHDYVPLIYLLFFDIDDDDDDDDNMFSSPGARLSLLCYPSILHTPLSPIPFSVA
uniref:Glycosyltransferase family 61 protein n=1 Tax=Moniliophthora roreri TaxID=221103 RepID=A0A0W0G0A7_MONRR